VCHLSEQTWGIKYKAPIKVKFSIYRLQYQQHFTVLIQKELTDIVLVSFSKKCYITERLNYVSLDVKEFSWSNQQEK